MSDQTGYSLACRNCGAPLDRDDNFCRNCGTRILKPSYPPEAAETPGTVPTAPPDQEATARLDRITSEPSEPADDEPVEPPREYEEEPPTPTEFTTEQPFESATSEAPGSYPHPSEPAASTYVAEPSRRPADRTWWIIGAIVLLVLLACCCIGLALAGVAAADTAFQQELRSATMFGVAV